MKRIILVLLGMMLITSLSFAEDVEVTIPEYDVNVNGVTIDTEHSQYPVLSYNGVTYFPLTFDYLSGVGLTLDFDSKTGLKVDVKDTVEALNQSFLGTSNVVGSTQMASVANYHIEVNGKVIDNSQEEYPVITFRNITYFPMTWQFAVTEFGWTTSWDDDKGYSINIVKEGTKSTETKVVLEEKSTAFTTADLSYNMSLVSNNSVGNEWYMYLMLNDEMIKSNMGDLTLKPNNGFIEFKVVVYEEDKANSDYGYGMISVPVAVFEERQAKTYECYIVVEEDAGRYAGNTAKVRVLLNLFE